MKQEEETIQWLVQWKRKSVEEATCEDEFAMRSQFPTFRLEDKTAVKGGGRMIELDNVVPCNIDYA